MIGYTPIQTPINAPINDNTTIEKHMNNISYEAFNLIMAEQEKRHQAEIEKIKAELNLNEIQRQINELKQEMKEEEDKEPVKQETPNPSEDDSDDSEHGKEIV
jgi:hypothetical protein